MKCEEEDGGKEMKLCKGKCPQSPGWQGIMGEPDQVGEYVMSEIHQGNQGRWRKNRNLEAQVVNIKNFKKWGCACVCERVTVSDSGRNSDDSNDCSHRKLTDDTLLLWPCLQGGLSVLVSVCKYMCKDCVCVTVLPTFQSGCTHISCWGCGLHSLLSISPQ